jgi:peptidyl-prolyl cis-trans isomerase B (cyclophilin B)
VSKKSRKSRQAKATPAAKGGGKRARPGGASRDRPRRKRVMTVAIIALAAIVIGGVTYGYLRLQRDKEPAAMVKDRATVETSKGTFVMELYPTLAPITVANFEKLAKAGFYDGLVWHRVEDWVVQTGDPTGTGRGGSEEAIALEIAEGLSHVRGAVGMARRGDDPNSATSQFYIVKSDATFLDGDYAVFGLVVEGLDVVDKLAIGDTMIKVTVEAGEAPK